MKSCELSGAIVTYNNSRSVLSKAISSFLDTDLGVRLYIIDNSPTDDLRDISQDPRVEYIFMNANLGFGTGHNVILRSSEKMGKYHLVLNPDIHFKKGTLEHLYEYMEKNPNVGNVMPKVIYPNGELQYLCKLLPTPKDWIIRMFVPIRNIREKINNGLEMRFADYNKEMNVPFLSGCFMFLRKSVIEEIGVFDEGIFMYCEDIDLNRRIYKRYRTMYYPQACITHNFERGSHKNARLLWIHIKAAIYYLNKWGWFFDKERAIINLTVKQQYTKQLS